MTQNIFEIFNPGDRHWRENKDFEKVHVFTTKKGGRGPMQVDLDDKTIVLPGHHDPEPGDDAPVRRGSGRARAAEEGDGDQPPRKRPAKPRSAQLRKG